VGRRDPAQLQRADDGGHGDHGRREGDEPRVKERLLRVEGRGAPDRVRVLPAHRLSGDAVDGEQRRYELDEEDRGGRVELPFQHAQELELHEPHVLRVEEVLA